MLSSSVPVKTVTTGANDPEFRPITPLVKMLLLKRYRLRRKGRVDAANVVAQQTSMALNVFRLKKLNKRNFNDIGLVISK